MSKGVEQFYQEVVSNDSAVQERLKAATDLSSLAQLSVELGAEKGYNFTAEEVEAVLNQEIATAKSQMSTGEELSEEQLEAVAGGFNWKVFGKSLSIITCFVREWGVIRS